MEYMNAKDDILKSKCKLRVLFLGPHTDDVDIGANTTIYRAHYPIQLSEKGPKLTTLFILRMGMKLASRLS